MIKIKYNSNTGQILGNYPPNINYPSITIDKEGKTITDQSGIFPYIEITKEQHQEGMGKNMVVVNGNYQEYVKTSAELLQEAKNNKIAEIKKAKDKALYLPVKYNGNYFHTSEKANINILGVIGIMEDLNLPTYPWISSSGQAINLTLTDFKQLRQLIGSGRGSSYSKEADRTLAVMTAKDLKEVNDIKW